MRTRSSLSASAAVLLAFLALVLLSGCITINVQAPPDDGNRNADVSENRNDDVNWNANVDSNSNANINSNANVNSNMNANTDVNTNSNGNGNVNSNTNGNDNSNSNTNANGNANSNGNDNGNTNANSNANTETSPRSIAAGTLAFIVRYSNYAWGLQESITLIGFNGNAYTIENETGHFLWDGKSELSDDLLETIAANGEPGEVDADEIAKLWEETMKADFDAAHTKPEHMADDYGSFDVYVMDESGTPHWICESGDSDSCLDDPHVEDAAEFFHADL